MTFLHPILFAAGLAAVAIPILIHLLLRQRRRPIMWGAMRFLIEAYRRQRKRLRIEQWLLLAARCLLVAVIGAALARPLLRSAGLFAGPAGREVYVLLDNGLASSIREGDTADTAALERHKKTALDLLATLGPADRAGLVLLGSPAKTVVLPASADIAAVRRFIQEAEATDSATDLNTALSAVASVLPSAGDENARPATILILSDFLLGSADTVRPLPAALADRSNTRLLISKPRDAANAPGNIQITAVEPLRPLVLTGTRAGGDAVAEREQVRITLRRSGPIVAEPGATTVRLRASTGAETDSAVPPAQAVVRWQPGQAETGISIQVNPVAAASDSASTAVLTAEIDRDAIPSDNIFRRPLGVRESLRVGIIARPRFGADASLDRLSPADWLRLALRPTPATPIDVIDIEPTSVDTPTLSSVDAVFAPAPDLLRDEDWSRLRRFVDAGGLLVVTPAADAAVHLWTDAMTRELALPWRLAREPVRYTEPIALDEQVAASPLLALIAAEIPSLVRPISVARALPPEETGRQTEILLRLKDQSPWIIASEPGAALNDEAPAADGAPPQPSSRGLVLYIASAPMLSWTDLPAKPLMVPLIQELARQGFGRAAGAWSSIAGRPVQAPARATQLRSALIEAEAAMREPIAVAPAGFTAEPIRRAGLFRATDEAGRFRGLVAVNPDHDAGRTAPQDPSAVRAWLGGAFGPSESAASDERIAWIDAAAAAVAFAPADIESPFSLPLLIAAIILAVAELIMARYFSHAFADRNSPSVTEASPA